MRNSFLKTAAKWAFGNWLWGVVAPGVAIALAAIIGWFSDVPSPWVYVLTFGVVMVVSPLFAIVGRRAVRSLLPTDLRKLLDRGFDLRHKLRAGYTPLTVREVTEWANDVRSFCEEHHYPMRLSEESVRELLTTLLGADSLRKIVDEHITDLEDIAERRG